MYNHEETACCCHNHGHGHYPGHYPRRFLTKEEQIEHLTKYKEWLQNEAKGIDEAIANLKEA